jgi:hypothetical protein
MGILNVLLLTLRHMPGRPFQNNLRGTQNGIGIYIRALPDFLDIISLKELA